jgi:hypothetical protein
MTPSASFRTAASLAVLFALSFPATAMSAPHGGERILFRLHGSKGYKIYAIGEGATSALVVTRGRHRHDLGASASIYMARARTSRKRLEARFGKLGRIDVRFHPSGRVTYGKRHRHCRGPDRYTTKYGVFAGTVRFRGEDAYTTAKARRVKGKVVAPAVLNCADFIFGGRRATIWDALTSPSTMTFASRPSPEAISSIDLRSVPKLPHLLGGRGRRTALHADWRLGVEAQAFAALQRGHRRPVFFAGTLQARERLAIVRLAAAVGTPADLLASDSLGAATVTPPAPFGGEGSFRHHDDGEKSWTGSLAVSFPGAPSVPMTGPQFDVGLSRGF